MGIKLLDKKISILLIILLFATINAYGEEVTIPTGELSKDDLILQQAQQQVLATSNVSTRLDQVALQNQTNLELVATILIQNQEEMQTIIIITLILVTLASQGLWWAIYLYLQTKGVLPTITSRKPKKQKKETDLSTVFE